VTRLSLRGTWKDGPGISDAGLRHVGRLRKLRRLDLSYNHVTNEGLKHLRSLAELEFLCLYATALTNDGLVHLRPLRRLRYLQIPSSTWRMDEVGNKIPVPRCTQEGFAHLRGSSIEVLEGPYLDRQRIELLAGLPQLTHYDIDWDDPYDTDLRHLAGLRRLENLSVYLQDGWTNTARLRDLGGMTGLTALEISGDLPPGSEFDPRGLAALPKLTRLERLRLCNLTDRGTYHVPPLPQVRALDLSTSGVTGEGLRVLDRFANVEVLSLPRAAAISGGLANLPKLPHLKKLWVSGMPIRGQGLSHLVADRAPGGQSPKPISLTFLQRLPALEELDLSRLPLRDEDLEALVLAPKLKRLSAHETPLTDAAIAHVTKLEHLEYFDLVETEITIGAARKLHEAHPRSHITDNWCCGCMAFDPIREPVP
jgi:hypothetical protein